MKYVHISFNDLNDKARDEILNMAREELRNQIDPEEAEVLGMDIDDLIEERIDSKILEFSCSRRIIFNI